MTDLKPITLIVREEDGIQRGVDVFSEDTKAEVRAFFKRLWTRYPRETAACLGESRGMSVEETEELRTHIEDGVRVTSEIFDPENRNLAEES